MNATKETREQLKADFTAEFISAGLTASDPSGAVPLDYANEKLLCKHSSVSLSEFYVRAMWVVSDQVNSYDGVLPRESHKQLATLLVGSSVLVGHQTDTLPIARIFAAELVERENVAWVKTLFYWMREADGAETLRANIDGGIGSSAVGVL